MGATDSEIFGLVLGEEMLRREGRLAGSSLTGAGRDWERLGPLDLDGWETLVESTIAWRRGGAGREESLTTSFSISLVLIELRLKLPLLDPDLALDLLFPPDLTWFPLSLFPLSMLNPDDLISMSWFS